MLNDIYGIKNNLSKKGILFTFSGYISQPILSGLVKSMQLKLSDIGVDTKIIRVIFELSVEVMQNILNYSSDTIEVTNSRYESSGIVLIGYNSESKNYFIIGGNTISSDDREGLEAYILDLNSKTKAELKDLYKERRRSRSNNHDRGAGLGLIDMARKSSQPIEYNFNNIEDSENLLFFSIKLTV